MAVRRAHLCLLVLGFAGICCADTVTPLVAWSNSDVLPSGSREQCSCAEDLLSATETDSVELFIVFKANKLSFDDIAKYGGVYGEKKSPLANLQTLVQSAESNVWAGVKGHPASELIQSLSEGLKIEPINLKGSEKIPISEGLVVVELPESSGENGFAQQDAVIAEVMEGLGEVSSFIAFYTSDNIDPTSESHVRQRRGSGSVKQNSGTGTNCSSVVDAGGKTCIAVCFTHFMIELENSNRSDDSSVKYTSIEFIDGACNGTDPPCEAVGFPCLKLRASNSSNPDDPDGVELTLLFPSGPNATITKRDKLEKNFWRMDVVMDDRRFLRARETSRLFERFAIPIGVSYACAGDQILNRFDLAVNDSIQIQADSQYDRIQFYGGVQVQFNGTFKPSKTDPTTIFFASAYNCQGFFTVATWMGIFTILLLLLILYMSIVFIFSIQTIDRFDDPRGPTISVENLH